MPIQAENDREVAQSSCNADSPLPETCSVPDFAPSTAPTCMVPDFAPSTAPTLSKLLFGDGYLALGLGVMMVALLAFYNLGAFAPYTEMPAWLNSPGALPRELHLSFTNFFLFAAGAFGVLLGIVRRGCEGGQLFLLGLLLAMLTFVEAKKETSLLLAATATSLQQLSGCGAAPYSR